MSVGVVFSTATGSYQVFSEARVNELIERLAAPISWSDSTW